MPIICFLLLLEGKADFKGCGTLLLPSHKAFEQASSDVMERLSAIKSVDLRKNVVGFEVAGNSEIPPGECSWKFSMLTLTHSCFTTTGNISSLASLTQLTSVNFYNCRLIEGNINCSHESTRNNGLGHYESLMPQGNNLNVPRKFFAIPAGRVFESTTSPHFFPAHANSNG